MQQNWGSILRWKLSSQDGSTGGKITRITPKLKQRKTDSVELVETLTIKKSHGEEPMTWTSSLETKWTTIKWNWGTKKKSGDKFKDERWNIQWRNW